MFWVIASIRMLSPPQFRGVLASFGSPQKTTATLRTHRSARQTSSRTVSQPNQDANPTPPVVTAWAPRQVSEASPHRKAPVNLPNRDTRAKPDAGVRRVRWRALASDDVLEPRDGDRTLPLLRRKQPSTRHPITRSRPVRSERASRRLRG